MDATSYPQEYEQTLRREGGQGQTFCSQGHEERRRDLVQEPGKVQSVSRRSEHQRKERFEERGPENGDTTGQYVSEKISKCP